MNNNNYNNNHIPNYHINNLSPQNNNHLYDQQFKQNNKPMYNSSMDFGPNANTNTSLNSFARQVVEPVNYKEQYEPQRQTNFNNQEKYNGTFNKYSGTTGKDPKMASSAIFPNNLTNPADFNRFPSFNLGTNNQNSENLTQNPIKNHQN